MNGEARIIFEFPEDASENKYERLKNLAGAIREVAEREGVAFITAKQGDCLHMEDPVEESPLSILLDVVKFTNTR